MNEKAKSLAQRIRKLRRRLNMSQSDLARALNGETEGPNGTMVAKGRANIHRWEAGKSYPDEKNLIALASVLKVSLEELTDGGEEAVERDLEMVNIGAGKARLKVNMVVPVTVAAQVVSLLSGVVDHAVDA